MRNKIYIISILLISFIHWSSFGQNSKFVLQIQSNKQIPESILKKYTKVNGDSLFIRNQLVSLLNDFYTDGYLAASVDSLWFESSVAHAKVNIGMKYTWALLDLSMLDPDLLEKIQVRNRKKTRNKVVHVQGINTLKKQIVSFYENSGYPFASVRFNPFEMDDSVFKARVEVNKGNYYTLDSILIKGDAKISRTYVQKILNLVHGTPYNQKKINQIEKKISNLSFLAEIKPSEIEFSQDAVDLYIYLTKKKANSFNGIIGFLPENEKTGKMIITGELNLHLVNSFGRGEDVFLNWEKLESSSQKLNLGFNYPYIFKSNFGLDADFSLFKKDSTFLSLNTGFGIRLFLSNPDYIKAYYRYKSSTRIADDPIIQSSLNYADVKSNLLGVQYFISKLDYKINPRKGLELNIFAGTGFKNLINAKSTIDSLNLNADYTTVEVEAGLDLNVYYPIYNQLVIHFGNTTRFLDQFADEGKENLVFENELYRFGGAKSLRGFDESIFFASIYSLQNVEIRYLFEKNSAFSIFWNGAYYYKNVSQTVVEDFPWGFGVGIDFDTRAGIFSLSYALGKQFDNPIEIRMAKIHFGYISRF